MNINQNERYKSLQENTLCIITCICCVGLMICGWVLLYPLLEKLYGYFNIGIEMLNYKISGFYRPA